MTYKRIAQLKTAVSFQDYLAQIGVDLPFDEAMITGDTAPLAQPYALDGFTIGNRFCVQPMEGWDGTADGFPTELTTRRWQRFGLSGGKLIWGGEAVAVQHDGRANPNQLLMNENTLAALAALRSELVTAHERGNGRSDDLFIGLQLTHSGRFARPDADHKLKPRILYRHPYLDKKFGISADYPLLTDDEIGEIIANMVQAAVWAQQIGFHFVDVKHCHGYLGHEFLTAYDRPGKYGGSFENRTRFLREVVAGIRQHAPGLAIGVRLSAFDWGPFEKDEMGVGETAVSGSYPHAFGGDETGTGIDLREPIAFLKLLQELDIKLVNLTAGSPYYVPHIQRPALFPPSDGYLPPEDPLAGVARQIAITAELKKQFPDLAIVGTGYSYLQEWLPHVAQAVVRQGMADFVGLGRMILSYPELPADVLTGKEMQRKLFCRTFSDCTTAPRNGLVSGCYPLDEFYKHMPEAAQLKEAKSG
ncbi:MAG: NADH:flavin oxidoreductase [Anaerolineae bacterium]|nr:NADH:flavin oxidoreductase [Anaerolineae bacterium]